MLRKIRRNVARMSMQDQGWKLFGQYAPVTCRVMDKRTGREKEVQIMKSVFARNWRKFA